MENTCKPIIVKVFGNKSSEFIECLSIRRKVFIEEQRISEELEVDDNDKHSYHYLLMIDESKSKQLSIGTARWRITEYGIKLERFAVVKEYRNRGYGKFILMHILNDTIPLGKRIYLHAQETAVNFYKNNGFEILGNPFIEAGIKHYKMVYTSKLLKIT